MTRPQADWIGWIFQFIAGFVVGAFFGFVVISRRRHAGWWVDSDVVVHFILGAGLLGGALASHYGDNLWMETRTFPLYENAQSGFSNLLSLLVGIVGGGLMVFAVLRTLGIA